MVFMLMLMLQSGDRGAAGQRHKVHIKKISHKKKGRFTRRFTRLGWKKRLTGTRLCPPSP